MGVRISPEDKYTFKGIDFDESLQLAKLLAQDGTDFIHISPWDALKKPEKYLHLDKTMIEYFRVALPAEVAIMVAGEIWTGIDAEKSIQLGADFVALGKAAIGIPDFPSKAKDPNFIPQKPPYTIEHLQQADLGEAFIAYMKRWQGFVQ